MDPRIEKLLKLPLYQRWIILGAICATIIAATVYFIYLPQIEECDKLQKKNEALETQLVKDRRIANNLSKFKLEYEKMQEQLNDALKELPNQQELPALLTSIASLAKDNRLEVLMFKPGKEVPQGFYADVPVSLKLLGAYHDVAEFFQAVGDLSRIVNISGLSIKEGRSKEREDVLAVDCTATTFRFIDSAAQAAGNKGGKRR